MPTRNQEKWCPRRSQRATKTLENMFALAESNGASNVFNLPNLEGMLRLHARSAKCQNGGTAAIFTFVQLNFLNLVVRFLPVLMRPRRNSSPISLFSKALESHWAKYE